MNSCFSCIPCVRWGSLQETGLYEARGRLEDLVEETMPFLAGRM